MAWRDGALKLLKVQTRREGRDGGARIAWRALRCRPAQSSVDGRISPHPGIATVRLLSAGSARITTLRRKARWKTRSKNYPVNGDGDGAGRTDAGVHALGQVAHFDLAGRIRARQGARCLESLSASRPVSVLRADAVGQANFTLGFPPRRGRHYLFRILTCRSPLAGSGTRHVSPKLDAEASVRRAYPVGQHDFTTFRAAECQAQSPVKTLIEGCQPSQADEILGTKPSARSFLHHHIRSLPAA